MMVQRGGRCPKPTPLPASSCIRDCFQESHHGVEISHDAYLHCGRCYQRRQRVSSTLCSSSHHQADRDNTSLFQRRLFLLPASFQGPHRRELVFFQVPGRTCDLDCYCTSCNGVYDCRYNNNDCDHHHIRLHHSRYQADYRLHQNSDRHRTRSQNHDSYRPSI